MSHRMIISLIIFVVVLIIDIVTDYRLWSKGKPVKHFSGAILRIVGLIPAVILGGWETIGPYFFGYWILQDSIMGLLIARNPFYLGDTAQLDIWQKKNNWNRAFKYIGFVAFLTIFLIYKFY